MNQKVDVLVFAVHPDDAELSCAGTILKLKSEGKRVAIVDLTQGELGTRGSAELRLKEAEASAKVMGLDARENLAMKDGFFVQDEASLKLIASMVRKYQPTIVFANAPVERHPDHGRSSKLVRDACFLAGLRRVETELDGEPQAPWRPARVFFYIQDYLLTPSFVVDITPFFEQKIAAIRAFGSQFHDPNSKEPETMLTRPDFLNFIEARARDYGHIIGATFGEGFISETPLKVSNLLDLA